MSRNKVKERESRLKRDAKRLLDRERALAEKIAKLLLDGCKYTDVSLSYLVSPDGDIYSTLERRLLKMRPGKKAAGYRTVSLCLGGGLTKAVMVHRLVAKAFIPNPLGLPEVNHIDGNKSNNSYKNLEWCTRLQNARHCSEMGLMPHGVKNPQAKLRESDVAEIRASKSTCAILASVYGVCAATINKIKRGRSYKKVLPQPDPDMAMEFDDEKAEAA